jgi:hypothetical protein
MKRITRKAAKKEKRRYFFTGRACQRGHVSKRFVSNGRCVECLKHGPRYKAMIRRRNRRYQAEHAHKLLAAEYGSETEYMRLRRSASRKQQQSGRLGRARHLADLAVDPFRTVWCCSRCGEVDTMGEPWCLGYGEFGHSPVYRYPDAKAEYIAQRKREFQQSNLRPPTTEK